MIVRMTKARHEDRPHTFTCVRSDGSVTGMPSTGFFVRHDLTHYAVETTMNFCEAFYGLLAKGWDIDSFGEREAGSRKAKQLPAEAILAEIIVGTLDLDWAAGPIPADEGVSIISQKLVESGLPLTSPTADQIAEIRQRRSELIERWRLLEPGQVLELTFPLEPAN